MIDRERWLYIACWVYVAAVIVVAIWQLLKG